MTFVQSKPSSSSSALWAEGVSIIVPTFRRPASLKCALETLKYQSSGGKPLELIISDNDPAGSAKTYVQEFAAACNFPVIYVHAAKPGVANARNAALRMARGRYLAFLDDDQYASENWLSELLSATERYDAGLVFCPTHAHSEIDVQFKEECLMFFSRGIQQHLDGPIDVFFGCGNSIMDLQKCAIPSPPFCPKTNETGGEDDLLFSKLKKDGVLMAWTNATWAGENVEDWRMTHKYIRARSFAYGQGPSRICANPDSFDVKGLVRWSLIGCAQFCVFTPLALLYKSVGHRGYIDFMRKAAEGSGKVLWYKCFHPKIYGETALKAQLKRESAAQLDAASEIV